MTIKKTMLALAIGALLGGGAARAGVVGTFTAGGTVSPSFKGIAGQSSIGRSADGTQQRGLVSAVNIVPSATNLTQTQTYAEGDASVVLDDIVVTDPDSGEVITATLTLANTATGSLSTSGTATYTAATGVWTISGSVADVNTALAAVAFEPATENDLDTTVETVIKDAANNGPAAGIITLDVTGANDAPSNLILAATPDPVDEGSTVSLDGSFDDPDTGDTHTVFIDWGDGSTDTTVNVAAGVLSFSGETHVYADNGTYTITVTVTDAATEDTGNTAAVTVENVAPTATPIPGGDVTLGNSGTVSLAGQADPSSTDTTAGFHYSYDFNNDGDFADPDEIGDGTYLNSSTDASVTVPASYLSTIGSHTIRACIIDKDGGLTDYRISITVNEAPSLIVTTTQDVVDNQDGETSLREAIAFANSNADSSTITFNIAGAGPHLIQLDFALPDLSTDLSIDGPTAESVTVRGDGPSDMYRIFTINSGVTVSISALTVTNGFTSGNGGGINNSGTLTLTNSTLSGNGAGLGGGLANSGNLTLSNSTFIVNSAAGFGGGLMNTGGTAVITNCTFNGNTGTVNGGGVANFSTLTLLNCTISGNNSNDAGGLHAGGGATHVRNSIIGRNVSQNLNGLALNTDDHNLIGGDAKLAPPADNGGPTKTMALLYGSPALNAGNDAVAPSTDQRGLPRPVGITEIGAFEVQTTYSVTGYIRTANLAPVPGVSVQVSTATGDTGTPVVTDASGFYEVTGVTTGGYVVTPSKSGWTFNPTATYVNVTTANRAANFIATRNAGTYGITGRIATSDGHAIGGVSVVLNTSEGGVYNPVTTNSAGYYSFSGLPDGPYTVTPTKSGFTFSPATRSVTLAGASVNGQNFLGMNGHKIVGRIMTSNGTAIAGVTVTRSGAGASPVTSNSAGYYTFINVPDGNITVTPSKATYIFTPVNRVVTMAGADVSGQNFIGATGYSIAGRIATSNGTAMGGVTVTLDGGVTTTTNSAGYYTFTGVANGSHTVVPTKNGYTFVPAERTVSVADANVINQNFVGG